MPFGRVRSHCTRDARAHACAKLRDNYPCADPERDLSGNVLTVRKGNSCGHAHGNSCGHTHAGAHADRRADSRPNRWAK